MRSWPIVIFAAAAAVLTGCNSQGIGVPQSYSLGPPIQDGAPATPGCVPLLQYIAFSGTASLSATSAVANDSASGRIAVGVVSSVANSGLVESAYSGSSSDGSIQFDAQPASGSLSKVQGSLQISSAEWDAILAQLGQSQGQCVQSMTFDLEVAPDGTLYGGQVVLTVSGTPVSLEF